MYEDWFMRFTVNSRKVRALYAVVVSFTLTLSFTPAAGADSYNPLSTTIERGNVLAYVVEGGSVERNSYLAIMPPAVTSVDETRAGKWKWCTGLDDPEK